MPSLDSTHNHLDPFFMAFYASKESNQKITLKNLPAYHAILGAFLFVIACHVSYIPAWLSVLAFVSIFGQMPVIRQKVGRKFGLKKIQKTVQLLFFVAGVIGIWLNFGQLWGADVSICFLIICAICKLWELFDKRDGYVVLNLSLFVLASAFLWEQSLWLSIGVVISLIFVLFGFVALADMGSDGTGRLKTLSLVSLPAVPLLVVLFVFFPRLNPLWSMPMTGKQATTGVSDSMSPGDFSDLSKSTELAFRVEFEQKIPNRHDLYWRGLVFSQFDGKTWRPAEINETFWRSMDNELPNWATALAKPANNAYRVILEPTNQRWLFGLDYSKPKPTSGVGMNQEYNIRSYRPITQQFSYINEYYPDVNMGVVLSDLDKRINLQLPQSGNDKTRQFAKQLYQNSKGDTQKMIQTFQQYVVNQQFGYTLSPPKLGQNRIDEFLFGTRQGFCEHYASSFVFLMRSAGVPSRVVAGYQGGELGRDGHSWEVRQMDAHAWAEVWIDGVGWARVDPTAFVSPERIEDGMTALTEDNSELFGSGVIAQIGYQQFRFLNTFRKYSDQVSYYWQKDVVGFDSQNQKQSLFKWFNITSLMRQMAYLVGIFVIGVAGFIGVFWYKNRKVYHSLDLPLVRLSKSLKHTPHLQKQTSETPLAYITRLGEHAKKSRANTDDVSTLTNRLYTHYRTHRYGKQNGTHKQFIKDIKQLKKWLV